MQIKELLVRYDTLLNRINDLRKKNLTTEELKKLLFLMEYKYKYYEQFPEGLNFLESFYLWLRNFTNLEDIEIATHLIWNLIYFSQDEIKYLSELLYREKIKKYILSKIISDNNLKKYDYKSAYQKYWSSYISRIIFIALSDGAMIDYFRRVNNINNNNVITYYKLHPDEQKRISNTSYKYYFLIEDFVGTGTTFLRDENNIQYWLNDENISKSNHLDLPNEDYKPDGALLRFIKFWNLIQKKNYNVIFCPYIITKFARKRLNSMIKFYGEKGFIPNYKNITMLPSYTIPDEARVIKDENSKIKIRKWDIDNFDFDGIKRLCDNYYDKFIPDDHIKRGGDCFYGFGNRGLAVIKYNNTPNNTIYLIWHNDNNWHPLFFRNKRHESIERGI